MNNDKLKSAVNAYKHIVASLHELRIILKDKRDLYEYIATNQNDLYELCGPQHDTLLAVHPFAIHISHPPYSARVKLHLKDDYTIREELASSIRLLELQLTNLQTAIDMQVALETTEQSIIQWRKQLLTAHFPNLDPNARDLLFATYPNIFGEPHNW